MVYIYLPSPCYIDGNSFRFSFSPPPISPPSSSLSPPIWGVHLSFHITVFIVGIVESKRMSGKSEMCQRSLAFALIPPLPCTKLPSGSRLLIWVYYRSILTKYWVSATRISCCDRLTEWALSLQTLIQQRAVLSGGNLPQAGGQQGTF